MQSFLDSRIHMVSIFWCTHLPPTAKADCGSISCMAYWLCKTWTTLDRSQEGVIVNVKASSKTSRLTIPIYIVILHTSSRRQESLPCISIMLTTVNNSLQNNKLHKSNSIATLIHFFVFTVILSKHTISKTIYHNWICCSHVRFLPRMYPCSYHMP